jgi:DNA modification methylase
MLIVELAMFGGICCLRKMVASTAFATRSGWSVCPGIPWSVCPGIGGQLAPESGGLVHQNLHIIWHKPNHMPESVTDRYTKAHEYIFLFSKNAKYYFDHTAIKTPAKGKSVYDRTSRMAKKAPGNNLINCFRKERGPYDTANRRSVWSIITVPFKGAHSAAFPPELPELCIKAGSHESDIILDPFMGTGTTALVAARLNRQYIGFELNPEYIAIAKKRISNSSLNDNYGS